MTIGITIYGIGVSLKRLENSYVLVIFLIRPIYFSKSRAIVLFLEIYGAPPPYPDYVFNCNLYARTLY